MVRKLPRFAVKIHDNRILYAKKQRNIKFVIVFEIFLPRFDEKDSAIKVYFSFFRTIRIFRNIFLRCTEAQFTDTYIFVS